MLVANALLKAAKDILAAEDDYRYDPDHKHKPQGGGWTKTEKGWTKQKKETGNGGAGKSAPTEQPMTDEQKELDRQARSPNYFTRRSVATNLNTPASTLEKLAEDEDADVRFGVAVNLFTPLNGLRKLDYDSDEKYEDISKEAAGTTETRFELKQFKKSLGPQNHRGRSLAQLQADFIKNMDRSGYEDPEQFRSAQERVKELSPAEFGALLKAVMEDEEEA